MKNTKLLFLFSYLLFVLNCQLIGQSGNCGSGFGLYFTNLTNPGVQDGDDGNVDGNCEFLMSISLFSPNSPVTFTYTGNGSANPASLSIGPTGGIVTVTGPCASTNAAFDVFFNGVLECSIVPFALPVELTAFSAQSQENGVSLQWTTATELQNLGFELERSIDGLDWHSIAFIEGKGNSNIANYYEYLDQSPFPEINFYRLKQMDFDGEFSYSNIIAISYHENKIKELLTYPNPTIDIVNITYSASEQIEEVILRNQFGQVLKRFTAAVDRLSLSSYPAGWYTIEVKSQYQRSISKIVKK